MPSLGGSFTWNPGRIGGFALLIVRYARCLLSRVDPARRGVIV
jgi:hypothetical protein